MPRVLNYVTIGLGDKAYLSSVIEDILLETLLGSEIILSCEIECLILELIGIHFDIEIPG